MTATATRPLRDLRADDAGRFGGKSATLGELLHAGIPVPPGFALETAALAELVAAAGIGSRITRELAAAGDEVGALRSAAGRIGDAILEAAVPPGLVTEVERRYDELAAAAGEPVPPVAVRSSALGEDGAEATFAGQQETILWVRGADDVLEAIRRCWASLYSAEAISYRQRLGEDGAQPAMGVTVQLMVDAHVAGVMFTCNPVSGDRSMIAINAAWGLGLTVVGGDVTPDDLLVSKVTGEVIRQTIGAKHVQCVPRHDGQGTELIDVAPELRDAPCLEPAAVAALLDVGRRVERYFGAPQDIEWAIARAADLPRSLFVVQSRPVTGLPPRATTPRPASAMAMVLGTFGAADLTKEG
jgi:pyruvate,water dikinase